MGNLVSAQFSARTPPNAPRIRVFHTEQMNPSIVNLRHSDTANTQLNLPDLTHDEDEGIRDIIDQSPCSCHTNRSLSK